MQKNLDYEVEFSKEENFSDEEKPLIQHVIRRIVYNVMQNLDIKPCRKIKTIQLTSKNFNDERIFKKICLESAKIFKSLPYIRDKDLKLKNIFIFFGARDILNKSDYHNFLKKNNMYKQYLSLESTYY